LLENKIKKDINDILEVGDFILGSKVDELENKLAKYTGMKYCVTCGSGTDALLIPLMAYNISEGDAVFTTNYSFFATTEVISQVGAKPIFVDIDPKTFNLDPELLESQIKDTIDKNEFKPKAIIAVDLFGQLADYSKIQKIAKKYNLLLIEDAAQSFGAKYKDKKSCSFGDVAATSFFPAKPLGCYGDGGAIFTNDIKYAEIFKSIRVHGQGTNKYDNVRIGLNSRLDTIQASVLLNKLTIFDDELLSRQNISSYYSNSLENLLETPYISNENFSSWAQYSLLANDENSRDEIVELLNRNDIPTAIYYKNIFSKISFYNCRKSFPISENISKRIFSIPMHPYLTESEMDKIIDLIIEYFKK
tara:strand:+ start:1779 stop:2861 length:1083 start_codon:yes stop_codon:yes gene_type:complete